MGGKFKDLTGETFGELKVVSYIGHGLWDCLCSCGKHKIYRSYTLTHGDAITCGHGRSTNKSEDLTNKKFGHWTVIEYAGNSKWKCQCDCEDKTIKEIRGSDLKSRASTSCGCSKRKDILGKVFNELTVIDYNKSTYKWICRCSCGRLVERTRYELENRCASRCIHEKNYIDITNQKFGEWTALEYVGDYTWKCRCSCGKIKNIGRYDLISGRTTSCGHTRKRDLVGKTFGELTVIKYLGDCKWECECSCGNKTSVFSANLLSGGTKSCGCKNRALQNIKSLDEILTAINESKDELGYPPFKEYVAKKLGISYGGLRKYIIKYELEEYFNKTFGSHYEMDIYNICKDNCDCKIKLHDKQVISPRELDIYIPDKKLAIEFNGTYWHSDEMYDAKYHQDKTVDCAKLGIRLIHIFEYEWVDKDKQPKIKKFLEEQLRDTKNTCYARNTDIVALSREDAQEFLNENHLQNYAEASIRIGLAYKGELVSVMTFAKPRFSDKYDYEIVRYCNKIGWNIPGGASKLLKHFIRTYNPESILTYSDVSKFTGNVYAKIGFSVDSDSILTAPNYVWVNNHIGDVKSRYETQKHMLVEQGLGSDEYTEDEIMRELGYLKVYDCGSIRLTWRKEN